MTETLSPMMVQWKECKEQGKDALLLFRLGDFYEAFYDDAKVISKELELTLTQRQGILMCGAPFHSIDSYIDKLISKGYKVAIAEQTEDPKQTKGLVKREVVRIITPGTTTSSSLLKEKSNNFFACISQISKIFGLAILDLSTSEFKVLELEQMEDLFNELYKIRPSELLVSQRFIKDHPNFCNDLSLEIPFLLNQKENWHFDIQAALEKLNAHFNVHNPDSLGLYGCNAAIIAAGTLLSHLQEELHIDLSHIRTIQTKSAFDHMNLDRATLSNLELLEPLNKIDSQNTLVHLLDQTKTPMGGRLLKQWIQTPLLSVFEITRRQDAIEELFSNIFIQKELASYLENIRDLERLMMKISSGFATPKDLIFLRFSLESIPKIKTLLQKLKSSYLLDLEKKLLPTQSLEKLIESTLVDNPPMRVSEGNVIREGFDQALDELRQMSQDSKSWIANYQNNLRETLGVKTLKVGFTKVFGYYIEVSLGQASKMPPSFQRKQTLVNAERFISHELKDFEYKILSSQDRILAIENDLFQNLKTLVKKETATILTIAKAIGEMDVLFSLSLVARSYNYIRPIIDEGNKLELKNARHPVIEKVVGKTNFIPNDTFLDNRDNQLHIITGPNMAGKSTYIRQVALNVILAQIGSFIPASSAHIGIIDQVFSRIGASDDLAKGQSTFMVEMSQTANILNHATNRSLIILDEIGRGTSTFDGIAIAWAVAEFLLTTPLKKAKTLFATHYSELTSLEKEIKGAINYQVKVAEVESGIVFLRKIIKGGTDKSYGIHVAKLAGLPIAALDIAKKMLVKLEKKEKPLKTKKEEGPYLSFFAQAPDLKTQEVISEIKSLDLNRLTPLEVQQKIALLQEKALKLSAK